MPEYSCGSPLPVRRPECSWTFKRSPLFVDKEPTPELRAVHDRARLLRETGGLPHRILSMKFGFFYLAEYTNMFVVSCFASAFFWVGYYLLPSACSGSSRIRALPGQPSILSSS